jgi:hypothetical protein
VALGVVWQEKLTSVVREYLEELDVLCDEEEAISLALFLFLQ